MIFFINNNRSYSITSFKPKWGEPSESLSAVEKYSQLLQTKDGFKAKRNLSPVRISPYKLNLSHFINKKNSLLKKYFEYKHAEKNRLFVREILGDILNNAVSISLSHEVKKCAQNLIKLSWNIRIFINIDDFTNVAAKNYVHYQEILISRESRDCGGIPKLILLPH